MEILEFHDMIMVTEESLEESDPVELNSYEFFIKALSYFEGEAHGTLSSEPSHVYSVESASSGFEFNAIKSELLGESTMWLESTF